MEAYFLLPVRCCVIVVVHFFICMYMSVGFHMSFSQEMFLFGKRASHSQVCLIDICYICVIVIYGILPFDF